MKFESSGISPLHLLAANLNNGVNPDCSVRHLPASAGDARDAGLIPGWERSLVAGDGDSLQYS